ncbi:MAG: AarF/UbiB family protein [Candidatus Nitrosocaldus sp.]|nr:AarF/UbiB family protein [Candidatus Nitrosocaldus sp.]MDW8000209.1 RIO1 family regulatory kinase/ATPase [Candidatus Nitrosocaldus sp.]
MLGIAGYVRDLEYEEVRVLKALARLMRDGESVDVERIAISARMHTDRVSYALSRLNERGLVHRAGRGYHLIYPGLDVLALRELADRGIIASIGRHIGVGKEADVLEAMDEHGRMLAVKFFRIGRISFRDVARKRTLRDVHSWLLISIESARREFQALRMLRAAGVSVPEAVALARHALVMEYIDGVRLVECSALDDPEHVLEDVLENIRLAHTAGMVSADLSEYNILYDTNGRVWIIDWPQSIDARTHPNAKTLLERDLKNILRFFRKRFGVEYDLNKAIAYVSMHPTPQP